MEFEVFKEKYQHKSVVEYPNRVIDKPAVSVCVPTYQHVAYIQECLDSIIKQKTTFPFEIIVGEDNSTDGTREICIKYANRYPTKIRLLLHNKENKVSVLGKTTGGFNNLYNFYSAKGKYIARCEGDDYWTDIYKLQKQFDFMEANPNYFVCGHDAFIAGESGIVKMSKLPDSQKRDLSSDQNQYGGFILTMSIFFRNPNFYPFEILNVINFDTFLTSYLLQFGNYKFLKNIEPACYRIHEGGLWSSSEHTFKQLSEFNTLYWLTKYFERQDKMLQKNFFGKEFTRRSMLYLVDLTWRNCGTIVKYMIKMKFPKLTKILVKIKNTLIIWT